MVAPAMSMPPARTFSRGRALRAAMVALVTASGACSSPPTPGPDAADVAADAAGEDTGADVTPVDVAADGPRCEAAGPTVVAFTTSDGVRLEGDLYTTGRAGGPGVVLLHMIPPANDRTNYPAEFIQALVAQGLTVLNVDRRGAGGSEGSPREAYLGPSGQLDARAAHGFLRDHPCAVDPARVAFVGASNGTTTALDYTVATAGEAARPRALVFLTGGMYTENQNRIADHRALLDPMPILFVYSTAERAWSAGLMPGAPAAWAFREYDPGDHGTRMFAVQPAAVDAVAEFLATALR